MVDNIDFDEESYMIITDQDATGHDMFEISVNTFTKSSYHDTDDDLVLQDFDHENIQAMEAAPVVCDTDEAIVRTPGSVEVINLTNEQPQTSKVTAGTRAAHSNKNSLRTSLVDHRPPTTSPGSPRYFHSNGEPLSSGEARNNNNAVKDSGDIEEM